ncbi:MAG: membrane-bound lytic murein transglycosylase A [Elusimicrobia bacterium]|nr:MAG: membrane-bound lytic murein transglycosylase A [Elusimicrobiota bacterium]
MNARRISLVLLAAAAGCLPPPKPTPVAVQPPPAPPPPPAFELVLPQDWPVLADDLEPESLERAADKSLAYLAGSEDKLWSLGPAQVGTRALVETLEALVAARKESPDAATLTARLKADFDLWRVRGSTTGGGAFYSSYYQPTLAASRKKTEEYRFPLYKRPADLVEVELSTFDPKWKSDRLYGRVDKSGAFVPYFSRRDIDVRGELGGKDLELVWLKDSFDRLNIHIQGSGLLKFPDGTMAMARFAGTNGRPYNSVGLSVIGSGAMTREALNSATLKQYLIDHPEGEAWIVSRNPRYTFFEMVDLPEDGEPNGTIGQALTAGRSIAIDVSAVPLGAACYVAVTLPQADFEGRLLGRSPVRRLMLAQDTGGAIKGPGRVDFYMGHGPEAATLAHRVWDAGELYVLLKKTPPRTR